MSEPTIGQLLELLQQVKSGRVRRDNLQRFLDNPDKGRNMSEIECVELSVRAYNALKKAGIYHVGAFEFMTKSELYAVKGLGRGSADEIIGTLKEGWGLELKPELQK